MRLTLETLRYFKITYCVGWSVTDLTLFLWLVRVTLERPAARSHRRTVQSWLVLTIWKNIQCTCISLAWLTYYARRFHDTEYKTWCKYQWHICSYIMLKLDFYIFLLSWQIKNKANLRDLIAATGLVILLKLDSNSRFFSRETPNLVQNQRFFLAEWPWNLTDDLQKQ